MTTSQSANDLGDGAVHYPGALTPDVQTQLAQEVWEAANMAGWITPRMKNGQAFSVRQMNLGPLGWLSDQAGYRYEGTHPDTGAPWPAIPTTLLKLWTKYLPAGSPAPECCLVNHYQDTAKMGLHKDADEDDQTTPIFSVSLGMPARFRLGGPTRRGPTQSVVLMSGDIMVMGGPSRGYYHGIDRLLPSKASSNLFSQPAEMPFPGRLNLTLRRVTGVGGQTDDSQLT